MMLWQIGLPLEPRTYLHHKQHRRSHGSILTAYAENSGCRAYQCQVCKSLGRLSSLSLDGSL
nr:hypothetical protein Iba_chr03dCG11740 [Ipomoea batatas]GMC77581.1 hypothetical protein Iba_chr03eCG12070 [Ipomoea batatas]